LSSSTNIITVVKIKSVPKVGTNFANKLRSLRLYSSLSGKGHRVEYDLGRTGIEEAMQVLVREPKGKRPLGGPRHRWEDAKRLLER
jgi:hypothetical protein